MDQDKKNHLSVVVLTTSGRWPTTGVATVPSHQKVRVVLSHAAQDLGLAGTDGWLATVGAKTLDVDKSFVSNGFAEGSIEIDWGPRQGGGGHA